MCAHKLLLLENNVDFENGLFCVASRSVDVAYYSTSKIMTQRYETRMKWCKHILLWTQCLDLMSVRTVHPMSCFRLHQKAVTD